MPGGSDSVDALLLRYLDAVGASDDERFGSVWAPSGVWELPGVGRSVGGDEAAATFRTLRADMLHQFQIVCGGAAQVDETEGTGRGRWYIQEFARLSDGSNSLLLGIYDDTYVMVGGLWRFASRTMSLLHRAKTPGVGRFYDHPGALGAELQSANMTFHANHTRTTDNNRGEFND